MSVNPLPPNSAPWPSLAFGNPRYLQSSLASFPATACTVSFWCNSGSGAAFFYGELDTPSASPSHTPFSVFVDSGVEVRFFNASVRANLRNALAPGVDHFISVVFEQPAGSSTATVSLYIDGTLTNSKSPITLANNGQPVTLLPGGHLYVATNPPNFSIDNHIRASDAFRGIITDLRIWSRAMTASEVAQDAMATVFGDEAGLYLALPLDSSNLDHSSFEAIDLAPAGQNAKALPILDDSSPLQVLSSYAFPTDSRTLEMWVRTGEDDSGTLFSYADNPNSEHPNDQGTPWTISQPSNLAINGQRTGVSVADGEWHHLAIVVNAAAGTDTIFVDGEQAYQGARTALNQQTSQMLVIGGQTADMTDRLFQGQISATYLWASARTADQILADSLPLRPEHDATFRGYWPCLAPNEPDISAQLDPDALSLATRVRRLSLRSDPHAIVLSPTGTNPQGITALPFDIGLSDFTFEAWVRTAAPGVIVSSLSSMPDQVHGKDTTFCLAAMGDGSLAFVLASGITNRRVLSQTSSTKLLDNTWHHVAASRSGTVLVAALDGVMIPMASTSGGDAQIDLGLKTEWTFGAALQLNRWLQPPPAIQRQWTGSLAEIRLWNRALLPGEIRGGMHHLLSGNEPGLMGLWGFDHANGQDRSPMARHASIPPGATFSADIVDLEPRDQPYLVVQTKLMDDYTFPDSGMGPKGTTAAPTLQTTYRIVVHAYTAKGAPLASQPITFSLQAESSDGPAAPALLIHTPTGTQQFPLSAGHTLTTNSTGVCSASVVSTTLVAPVIRLTAPFMPAGHALLVFPDRHAHYTLSQLTGAQLLGNAQVGTKTLTLLPAATPVAQADAIAKSVSLLMSAATEDQVQGTRPRARTLDTRLAATVPAPLIRHFENGYVSHSAFNASSDVSSGLAVDSAAAISRTLPGGDTPAWKLTGVSSDFAFTPLTDADLQTLLLTLNPQPQDNLARTFTPSGDTATRSPLTLAGLQAMLDDDTSKRSIFDFVEEISAAATVIVHAVKTAVDSAGRFAHAVMLVVSNAGHAKSVVMRTVHHAAAAVEGIFKKAGVAATKVIGFLKEVFNWSDILTTHRFINSQLRAVVPYVKQSLASTQAYTLKKLDSLKQQADQSIAQLQGDLVRKALASAQANAAFSQPQDVTSSYVSHLAVSHASRIAVSPGSTAFTPAATDPFAFLQGKANLATLSGQVGDSFVSFSKLSLAELASWLLGLAAKGIDLAIDLAKVVVPVLFHALETAFDQLDKVLSNRIEIPLVTALYEQVITKSGDSGGQDTLNFYSIASLLSAIPLNVLSKVIRGTLPFSAPLDTPFPQWPFDSEGNPRQATRTTPTLLVQLTWALGAVSTFLAPFAGVIANLRREIGAENRPDQRSVSLSVVWLNQLAQFPLLALEPIIDGLSTTGAIGIAVFQLVNWTLQFFPVAATTEILVRTEFRGGLVRHIPATDAENKILMVYGCFHALLYIGQFLFAQTSMDSRSPRFVTATIENVLRFTGNLAQCVPEIDTPKRNDPRIMILNYVMVGVSSATGIARFGMVVNDQVAFAAH